jgi:rare lipoprotein A
MRFKCATTAAGALASAFAVVVLATGSAFALELTTELSSTPGETGLASYYAKRFDGRRTASGTTFRNSELIAAHPSHPFGTMVRVTNLDKGSSVDVRIADRGAFGRGRGESIIIDLSQAAASRIDMLTGGRTRVLVEVLEWGKHKQAAKRAAQE